MKANLVKVMIVCITQIDHMIHRKSEKKIKIKKLCDS